MSQLGERETGLRRRVASLENCDYQSCIIGEVRLAKARYLFHDLALQVFRRAVREAGCLYKPRLGELLTRLVLGLGDAVGIEQEPVPSRQ